MKKSAPIKKYDAGYPSSPIAEYVYNQWQEEADLTSGPSSDKKAE